MLVWVPLIVKTPEQTTPNRVDDVTTSSDIPSLIMTVLPERLAGRFSDVFPNAPGNHAAISENYFCRDKPINHPDYIKRCSRVRTAIYDWPFKFIDSTDGELEIYQLEDDPAESHNLLKLEQGRVKSMTARLHRYASERPRGDAIIDQAPLSEEEIERLRTLGYIK